MILKDCFQCHVGDSREVIAEIKRYKWKNEDADAT